MSVLRSSIALLALTASSCVLFVPAASDVSESSCSFQGSSSDCGKCIAASCGNAVNACCLDASCASTLDALDQCASAPSQASCGPLVAPDESPTGNVVHRCVSKSCAAVCNAVPCSFDDLPSNACRDCMALACDSELATMCNNPSASVHVSSARDCAASPSNDNCVRLSPFAYYVPDSAKGFNACVAAQCGAQCPLNGANKCSGTAKSMCAVCCRSAFTEGDNFGFALDTACACPEGFCAYDCRLTAYCQATGPIPGDPCLSCLSTNDGWGQSCHYAEQCYGDLGCMENTICYAQCAGN